MALTVDHARQLDEAFEAYETALEVSPGYLPAIQGIARSAIRSGRDDARLKRWLNAIVIETTDEYWRDWARLETTKLADQ
ncbi:MAG: hypothetical protein GY722_08500, partial [bacterium]|nr:hypothetical protein [bacterium]